MSAPLSKGHDIERIERYWVNDSMRYMMVHRSSCRRCLVLSAKELIDDFNAIQDESGSMVIMVFPDTGGGWVTV